MNICLPLRRCGPLGARETGGRDIAFQGRWLDALYALHTFPVLHVSSLPGGCFICLTCLSPFPLLHVSSLPSGQICAMNKRAAKLRMKVYDLIKRGWFFVFFSGDKLHLIQNALQGKLICKCAIDLNWGWATEILYIQLSEFALIDWAWEIQIFYPPSPPSNYYTKMIEIGLKYDENMMKIWKEFNVNMIDWAWEI